LFLTVLEEVGRKMTNDEALLTKEEQNSNDKKKSAACRHIFILVIGNYFVIRV